ncbi:MAG: hypothetical protein JNM77_08890 [Pseudonocardia sp.]|nr:hypothetical protein [Pseudonocardia sp.]
MARDDRPAPPRTREVPPTPVRAAGALVGLEALAAAVFTAVLAVLAVQSGAAELGVGAVLAEAGFFLLVAVALGAVAAGLWTGRRWARTPAIVTQLLLLPVVYSLLGPSHQLLIGLVAGAVVVAAFLLLISERSRAWSMGDEDAR